MANLTSNDINKIVSFSVYPVAVLGATFEKVKVKAILDAESTFQWIDPVSLHANVYPTLPPGTPNKYDGYLYAKIELQNGTITCIGLPWIDEGSIVVHTNTTIQVVISDVEATDFVKIRDLLLLNGFNNINMSFVD